MVINTEILGEIEYQEEDVFVFADGLYGFADKKKFIIIDINEPDLPFLWLQSIEDGKLSFILTNPFLFCEEYDFELQQNITENLAIESMDQLLIYTMVVVKEDIQGATINLKAPLVINKATHYGKQIVLNEEYPYKYNIFQK